MPPGARSPLSCLRSFITSKRAISSSKTTTVAENFPLVHVLPFYPWDTDRGFSVKDYYAVSPDNGSWEDIEALAASGVDLMFDFVANHASVDNPMVQGSLIGRHLTPEIVASAESKGGAGTVLKLGGGDPFAPAPETAMSAD